jgi:anti-sigma-K factor RskA
VTHVIDDLELYAVGALAPERSAEVAAHLRDCVPCRAALGEIDEVVASLADAVPPRDPPARLKTRILAAAEQDVRAAAAVRRPRFAFDRRLLAAAAAFVIVAGFTAETMRLRTVEAEKAEYQAIAAKFAGGGRTWYMAGVEEWRGMGGNLMQPASGQPAFVVFHDLRELAPGQTYTLWLIAPDGKWVRGTSFRPDGRDLQLVEVGQELAGYSQCAVTVERSTSGKREGPVVMQSRIAPPGN